MLPVLHDSLASLLEFKPPVPIMLNQAELTFTPNQPPQQKIAQQQLGWRSESKNGLYVLQTRLDGFFFSRLFPYTTWEEFVSEGRTAARSLERIYTGAELKAVVVRYINELGLPVLERLEEYVKFYVFLPPELPQYMNTMFSRVELQDSPQSDTTVIVNSGFLPPVSTTEVRLLLDIEIKRNLRRGRQEIWEDIESLRDMKNGIFFSCLTDKMETKLR